MNQHHRPTRQELALLRARLRVAHINEALNGPAVLKRRKPQLRRRWRRSFRVRKRNTLRRLDRFIIRMSPGVIRPRRTNYVSVLARCVDELEKLHRRNPDWFSPSEAQLRQLEEARFQAELQAALDKVYGPEQPASPRIGQETVKKG